MNKEAARKQKQDKDKPESLLEMIKSILQPVSTTMTPFSFSSYKLIFRGFNKNLYLFLPTDLFPLSQFNPEGLPSVWCKAGILFNGSGYFYMVESTGS